MSTTAATNPSGTRPRLLFPALGTAFIGSTLVALVAPAAHAEPMPPEEPSASVELSFATPETTVDLGEDPEPNPLTAINIGDATACLLFLDVDASEFDQDGFERTELAPGEEVEVGSVSGSPRQENTTVTATLSHALADEEYGCAEPEATGETTTTWAVRVNQPTETPTDPPSETPSETPSPSPTHTPSQTPTHTPSPTPSATPTNPETNTPAPNEGSDGDRENTPTEPSSPVGGDGGDDRVGSPPNSGADIPTLPRDDADLPRVAPGEDDLAELPLVRPSEGDDELDEAEIAADTEEMTPSTAPAVLLATLLLALLLAAPLAPSRRVRLANGYQGKRRKPRP